MVSNVGAIGAVFRSYHWAVGPLAEYSLPEGTQAPVPVEDHDRMLGVAGQDVHLVLGNDCDPRAFDQPEALGQLAPICEGFLLEVSAADELAHASMFASTVRPRLWPPPRWPGTRSWSARSGSHRPARDAGRPPLRP